MRRFTLADAMILIAFSAAGFALARIGPQTDWSRLESRWYHALRDFLTCQFTVFASVFNLAVIPLRLRGSKVRARGLMRQPGTVAAVAVALVLSITLLSSAVNAVAQWRDWPPHVFIESFWLQNGFLIAPTVAIAWLSLAVQGRWRPVGDWVDRLGMVMGLIWILIVLPWPLSPWLGLVVSLLTESGTLL